MCVVAVDEGAVDVQDRAANPLAHGSTCRHLSNTCAAGERNNGDAQHSATRNVGIQPDLLQAPRAHRLRSSKRSVMPVDSLLSAAFCAKCQRVSLLADTGD